MPTTRPRPGRRPVLEHLECRLALSLSPPVIPLPGAIPVGVPVHLNNTFATANGDVPTPTAVGGATVNVDPIRVAGRRSTVLGLTAAPTPGSGLNPEVVAATGAGGQRLPFRRASRYLAGLNEGGRGYVKDGQPGALTGGVTGLSESTGPFTLAADLPGDVNGDGVVNGTDEQLFTKAYPSIRGQAKYNPDDDFNHNGLVGQDDARLLLRNLTPVLPPRPLVVNLRLSPGQQLEGPRPSDSGGVTPYQSITILGKTTPYSFVFVDGGLGNYKFNGQVVAADADGDFSVGGRNEDGINNYTFLVVDPYGKQLIRAFPVYWTKANLYLNSHPNAK